MAYPVIHYTFDTDGTNKGTGGPAHDLTNTGSLTFDTTNKISGTSSVSVTGSSPNAGDCPQFPFNTGVDGLHTMCFWMKMTEKSVVRYLFTTTTSSTDKLHYNSDTLRTYVRPGTDNTVADIEFVVWSALNNGNFLMSYVPPPYNDFSTTGYCDGNWHHFVMVSNNSEAANSYDLYLDNVLAATNLSVNSSNGAARFMFLGGCAWHGGGTGNNCGITGNVDDFRLYDYVLDSTAISGLFVSGLISSGRSVAELLALGLNLADLIAGGVTIAELIGDYTYAQLRAAGVSITAFIDEGISNNNILAAGFTQAEIDIALTNIKIHTAFTIKDGAQNESAFATDAVYTPATFAAKLTNDLGYTVTAGGDLTTTDSTPYYRLYLQFANAVTLTNMPKYIFNIPFSDFSVKAGGQVNLRNVSLDAAMVIDTSYDTTSNSSTIPAGNYFINDFVSTIGTDLNYTLSYDASNALIEFVGLGQDISMNIISNDTTIFDTSITEITTASNTLPFITYGQPDPTLTNYIDNGITAGEFISNGYTIPQLYKGGFIPDWTFDTDANHFAQSYVKDFIDISGSLALRENANLTVNGNIETKGNVTIKNQIMAADLSLNHNIFVVGDISMNGNVTVGDVSMNGTVVDCSFTDSSIPEGAFFGTYGPDYTQPTIMYEKGFDTTADVSMNANVQISNLKVDGNIEFSDGTTMNTYDDNKTFNYNYNIPYSELHTPTIPSTVQTFNYGEGIKCSADGKYVVQICTNDYPDQNTHSVGAAADEKSGILLSNDYGETFTFSYLKHPDTGTDLYQNNYACFSMSSSGQYMVCYITANTSSNSWVNSFIGYSANFGATWQTYYTHTLLGIESTPNYCKMLAINNDGSNIVIYISTGYISTGYDLSRWTTIGIMGNPEPYTNMRFCNNRIVMMKGNISDIGVYDLSGNQIGLYTHGAGEYNTRYCTAASSNSIIVCGRSSLDGTTYRANSILLITNVDTDSPTTTDISSINTELYLKTSATMSPSGKYILIGQYSNARMENVQLKDKVYYSNDYGATFNTYDAIGSADYLDSVRITDNGYIFTQWNSGGTKINRFSYSIFKPSTFTSLTINEVLTAGSFLTSSDYRIKTDVSQLDETVTLDNLRPVKYLQTLINKPQYGLIAHELQEYYPDLVVGEKDGEELQRVNYTGLIALLINEIKQLKRELTELENGM